MYIFPYQKKIIEEGELADPRLNLQLKTIKGFLTVKFLVDSGADVTTLPIKLYSELFDFKKDPNKIVTIGGVEGKGVAAYPIKLTAKLNGSEFTLRSYLIESFVDPLLGRLDFWNLFSINFDNDNLKTIIVPV